MPSSPVPLPALAAAAEAAEAAPLSLPAYLAVVVVIAVVAQWLAWAVRVPSLLLLLPAGFALGQVLAPDAAMGRGVVSAAASVGVGIILFEGSMTLRFKELRGISGPVIRLTTVVVAIAFVLLSGAAWLVGIDWRLAVLVGAIAVVTGPTVINPILRQMRPTRRVSSLLRWEGIVVDPIGAILAVLVFQAILAGREGDTLAVIIATLALTIGVAVGFSVPVGFALGAAVRRHWVPDYLQGVLFLAVAIAALVASNLIADEAGLLTVTVLGVVLGNQRGLRLVVVREFQEHLQVLLIGVLFVLLAGRVSIAQLVDAAPQALALLALAVIVVRPVSVLLGLRGTAATRQERLLLAFMAPRGIVAAAVTSVFALELQHAADATAERAADPAVVGDEAGRLAAEAASLAGLGDQAEQLVPVVFILIVGTVAIYGLGVGRLAERLGLASSSPHGVLFAGASPWVVQAARQLEELEVPTMVIAEHRHDLAPARMKGLATVATNILSEFAVEELELGGIGHFIGATEIDSTNSTAAAEFAHIVGRTASWQLRRDDDPDQETPVTRRPAPHLVARYPFAPAVTHARMVELGERGYAVRRTTLSAKFDVADFRAQHPEAVMMFTHRQGRLRVVTEGAPPPQPGTVLVAMMPERDLEGRTERNAAKRAAKKGSREAAPGARPRSARRTA